MLTRRTLLTSLLAAPFAGRLDARASPVVWAWSGGVSATGVIVKALAGTPGQALRLGVRRAESGAAAPAFEQTVVTGAAGVASFVVDGLEPRTRYEYVVSASAGAGLDGSFRTFADGPFSFRLGFASCARTGSTSPVFDDIRALRPDLFIHLGDLHYEDIVRNDPADFGRAYTRVLSSATQGPCYRHVPVAYLWDDHDFGPNDSDRTSPSRLAAHAAYRHYVPHYQLLDGEDAPICQTFSIGRVRMILTDARSARAPRQWAPSERTMLGARQLDWLEQQLAAAAASPLIIWANTVPWITKADEASHHGWAPYAIERRRIAGTIHRLGLTDRLVMVSGDAHMLALDDGRYSQYADAAAPGSRGFVVVQAAPMDQRASVKGGPYSAGIWRGNGQFGLLDVDDDGTRCRVTVQGYRRSVPVPGMRLVRDIPCIA